MALDGTLWSPPPQRIAVFRALQLGDLLCAVPALRALRAGAPTSQITLVGLPWAADFARRFAHCVDDFLAFPGFPGFPEREGSMDELLDFVREARARSFDLAIQLHGSGRFSNPLVQLMHPRRTAGFCESDAAAPDAATYIAWPERGPEVLRLLSLAIALGLHTRGVDLEFPLAPCDQHDCKMLFERFALDRGRYVCIHPGARLRSRRWPLERFAAVGRNLARDRWRIVVTGVADERALADELAQRIGGDAVSLAGATTLGSLGAIVQRSALLVCNDTGLSHVAAALRAPSVVVASASDVGRWAPLDRALHRVLAYHVPCRPCGYDVCPIGHPCALGVEVHDVTRAAREMLSKKLCHAA